jgi:hypothetical protein
VDTLWLNLACIFLAIVLITLWTWRAFKEKDPMYFVMVALWVVIGGLQVAVAHGKIFG